MRAVLLVSFTITFTVLCAPLSALECANVGAAWGVQPNDTGDGGATACGNAAVAGGLASTALGDVAESPGDFSTALGYESESGGSNSTALGSLANAGGSDSTAAGSSASSPGARSLALGHLSKSEGTNSTALGYRAFAPTIDTVVIGSIAGVNGAFSNQKVAIGTTAPLAPLHIFRDDGTAQVLVEETSMSAVPRTLFRLASAGSNAKFEIDNTMAGVNWAFTNSGGDFRISRQGSGVIEFRVDNAGNAFVYNDLEVGGDLFTNVLVPSDRNLKQNIEALDAEDVLEKVAALPVSVWEYKDRPGERHIGPMAQDFRAAFGLGVGETSISVVDASGVALASIQALDKRNRKLEAEVAELKELVRQLLPRVAHN